MNLNTLRFAALLSGALIASPLCAIELKGNTITLTDMEMAQCHEEGGCGVVTVEGVKGLIKQSYDEGYRACRGNT